jgi:hypothetical protein
MFLPTPERAERGDLAVTRIDGWAPDGDPPGSRPMRRVTVGISVRDRDANCAARLRRFIGLDENQIAAGVRFEKDWDEAKFEPRLAANMLGIRGLTGSDRATDRVFDARTRVLSARAALSACGIEMLRVVEIVLIDGVATSEAAQPRYRDPEKGAVYVRTLLDSGLRLLAAHYRMQRAPAKVLQAASK